MISEPHITADCEVCGDTEDFNLATSVDCATEYAEKKLKALCWIIDGDLTFCSEKCAHEFEEDGCI